MSKTTHYKKLALLGVLAGSTAAMADMPSSTGGEEWKIGLGINIETQFTPYVGVGSRVDVMPGIMIDAGNLSIRGPSLRYQVLNQGNFTLSALAQVREEYLNSDDSDELEGINDRDESIELGLGLNYQTQIGNFGISYYQGVDGNHDGYEASIGWKKSLRLNNNWQLSPYTQINFRSGDLNDYYFGVSEAETTAIRPAYSAGSSTDFQIGLSSVFKITPQNIFIVDASYRTLGSEIENSPIIDGSSSGLMKFIYIYRF